MLRFPVEKIKRLFVSQVGLIILGSGILFTSVTSAVEAPVSEATETCLTCHETVTPGIVEDWRNSRHAGITPAEALKKDVLQRRISAVQLPDSLKNYVVGCAECHTLAPTKHRDNYEHGGYSVHTVVTPNDCATCHPVEQAQFQLNIMSHAHVNLRDNPLYQTMMHAVNGIKQFMSGKLSTEDPDQLITDQACYFCHGTEVTVDGLETRETDLGEMDFPVLTGWPNQGVGRINPDDSKGSCSACHARHEFSIKVARQPYTCSECHKGPDVPAYKV